MSLIKIPDNLNVTITTEEELADVETLFLTYINENKEMEIIEKIAILMDLYEGKFIPKYNYIDYIK